MNVHINHKISIFKATSTATAKILSVIKGTWILGYTPNIPAQDLALGVMNTICFLIDDVSHFQLKGIVEGGLYGRRELFSSKVSEVNKR